MCGFMRALVLCPATLQAIPQATDGVCRPNDGGGVTCVLYVKKAVVCALRWVEAGEGYPDQVLAEQIAAALSSSSDTRRSHVPPHPQVSLHTTTLGVNDRVRKCSCCECTFELLVVVFCFDVLSVLALSSSTLAWFPRDRLEQFSTHVCCEKWDGPSLNGEVFSACCPAERGSYTTWKKISTSCGYLLSIVYFP